MGGHGSEEIMSIAARVALVCVGLGAITLLAGCPGMPGAPGSQQEMPPGMQPPRGMEVIAVQRLSGAIEALN